MNLEWNYSQEKVNWVELSRLYKIAPLGDKNPQVLENTFSNSMFKCFVYSKGQLVGVGRALADGADCSYICDIAVHPNYQGIGLGKSIVLKLVELSKSHKKIILYSVLGREGFYKKLGFKKMTTAMAIFKNEQEALASGLVNKT